jgi:hypothetical protein
MISDRGLGDIDMVVGISFEDSVNPCKTTCCNQMFCMEHISDVSLLFLSPKPQGLIDSVLYSGYTVQNQMDAVHPAKRQQRPPSQVVHLHPTPHHHPLPQHPTMVRKTVILRVRRVMMEIVHHDSVLSPLLCYGTKGLINMRYSSSTGYINRQGWLRSSRSLSLKMVLMRTGMGAGAVRGFPSIGGLSRLSTTSSTMNSVKS